MINSFELTEKIETQLNLIGNPSEKAKEFFVYVFDRTLSKIGINNPEAVDRAVQRCVAMILQAEFPWIKPNGQIFFIPAAVILDDLLYTDMTMTLFFINFVAFHLLLVLVHDLHPDFFEWLSHPPYPVPASFPGDHSRNAEAIDRLYLLHTRMKPASRDSGRKTVSGDPLRFHIVRALSGCAYLPFGTDYTRHNRLIFAGF